ncbi:Maf family protein [Abyssisolibacter fermentans]|uniref:Maf family protein n=1 Tax=Abyssisolibacter fermentans TaxID=1766203 RepID=UPI00082D049F|nr:Maf family protein [Abyssisolibacter fermentans]
MKKLILASASPRRFELLSKYDFELEVVTSDITEKINGNEQPQIVAMSLALQKALDVSNKVTDSDIIIAADTIVYNGQILGKPKNKEHAYEMLKSLSGKEHSVFTGIAVLQKGTVLKIVDYQKTIVEFKNLSDRTIENYLNKREYIDKAGSYAIQGLSAAFIKNINGSYSNVVGLPISKLDDILRQYFDFELLNAY